MPPLVMDRPPYYSVSRGSAPRSSAPRGGQDPRTGMERLPPVLPSSQSLPIGRQDELPPLRNTRLPPIQDSDTSQHAYYRPYPSSPDRPVMNAMRRPSPPLSVPVGMVSADYMPPRRSPGESFPPPFHPSHTRHPDPFRREVLPGHVSSHVPHHLRYDDPSAHMRHLSENESTQAGTPIKRPRVSLACLACRNRKSRCDGVRPTCKTCASMSKFSDASYRKILIVVTDAPGPTALFFIFRRNRMQMAGGRLPPCQDRRCCQGTQEKPRGPIVSAITRIRGTQRPWHE